MKKFYILSFFTMLFIDARSDWGLFPLKQKSFYYSASFSENFIVTAYMDTIANRANYDALFFNKTHAGAGYVDQYACFADLNPQNIQNELSYMGNFDSLIIRGDTVFYDSAIYFLPHATAGQSWPFKNQTMTCNSIGIMTFCGVTDSVKYFTSGQFSFTLSKNYGLVMFVPFWNIATNWQMTVHTLIGFEEPNGTTHGFLKPGYLDFFPYQPGDILVWKDGEHPPFNFPRINLKRDSITSIIYNSDSIKYFYDEIFYRYDGTVHYLQNQWKKFLVKDMINQLEAPTNWYAIVNNLWGMYPSALHTEKYIFENDSSISYIMTDWGYSIDSTDCTVQQITDTYIRYTYNTKRGHTATLSDFFYPVYDSLIGGVMNGVAWGDTALHVGVKDLTQQVFIELFPNPASDKITIKSLKKISQFEVINKLGIIIHKESVNENSFDMDISGLSSSIYIIDLIDESGARVKRKFIKN